MMDSLSMPFFVERLESLVAGGVSVAFAPPNDATKGKVICALQIGAIEITRTGDSMYQALALAKDDLERNKKTELISAFPRSGFRRTHSLSSVMRKVYHNHANKSMELYNFLDKSGHLVIY